MNEAMEEWRIKTRTSSIFNSVFFLIFLKAHIFVPSPASCQKDLQWWYWRKIMGGELRVIDGSSLEVQLRNVSRGKVHGRTGQRERKKGGGREEEEGRRRCEEGRKETKKESLPSTLSSSSTSNLCPYPHLNWTATLCIHIYVHRRCGCWLAMVV
jgi:hypothetical protein